VRVDGGGTDVEPAEWPEHPSSADLELARVAHGVDPYLVHTDGDDVVELDGPEVVRGVGERRRRGPDVGERRIEKPRNGRERGHGLRRHVVEAPPHAEAQAVTAHVVCVKLLVG